MRARYDRQIYPVERYTGCASPCVMDAAEVFELFNKLDTDEDARLINMAGNIIRATGRDTARPSTPCLTTRC